MSSIALVVLDTLRKDTFDRHFDWIPGRRYENAYSTANWTVPAHASLFTGRYASEVGVHAKHTYFDVPERVLAERLRDAGFTTRAFSANTNITGHFEFDRGFDDFHAPDQFDHLNDDSLFDWRKFSREVNATGASRYVRGIRECLASDVDTIRSLVDGLRLRLSDETGVEYGGTIEAIEKVRDMDFGEREFLFLNLMETHEPYLSPDSYSTVDDPPLTRSIGDIRLADVNRDNVARAYDDAARYLSDVYRNLFELVVDDFDYVITLSDHGELLGEHGAWGHEHGVYPELIRIPLTISGDVRDETHSETVSLVDVYETILDLAKVSADSRRPGRSLFADSEDGERLSEYLGLTAWSERNLREARSEEVVERYEEPLRGYAVDGSYGYETPDGFVKRETPPVSRERLRELVDALDAEDVTEKNHVPDRVKEQLQHLGYG